MADHFADRYWSTRFWSARYFQGGEVDPNAMQASLSGGASLTANLVAAETLEQILGSAARWKPKKGKKVAKRPEIIYDDDEVLVAFVAAFLRKAA